MNINTRTIKQVLFMFALMVGALTLVSFIPVASASFITDSDNLEAVRNATGGESDIRKLVLKILNFFLTFLGILAVIMVVYGGVTYVTSAGNDEAIGNAKKIIMYAVVGLIVILLSFAIIRTVLDAGTGGSAVGGAIQ